MSQKSGIFNLRNIKKTYLRFKDTKMNTQTWSKNSNMNNAGQIAQAATIIVSSGTISPRHDSKRNTGDTDS